MIDYFFWATIILFVITGIYFLIFLGLSFYYREKIIQIFVIPLIYAFEFFVIAFIIIFLLAIILHYLPTIIDIAF